MDRTIEEEPGAITFSYTGKPKDAQLWSYRAGTLDEQHKSAVGLLLSLGEEGSSRAKVWLNGKIVKVRRVVEELVNEEKAEQQTESHS
jgi:hypothetical protein